MTEMPMPDWANEDTRDATAKMLEDARMEAGPLEFTPVLNYSTHFGEWIFKDDDLLLHLFPRDGNKDDWSPTRYDEHGNYIPARREEKSTVSFPDNMKALIQAAADKIWMGDFAVDLVPELDAYAIQFQGAKTSVKLVGPGEFVDTFCEAIDTQLE